MKCINGIEYEHYSELSHMTNYFMIVNALLLFIALGSKESLVAHNRSIQVKFYLKHPLRAEVI